MLLGIVTTNWVIILYILYYKNKESLEVEHRQAVEHLHIPFSFPKGEKNSPKTLQDQLYVPDEP